MRFSLLGRLLCPLFLFCSLNTYSQTPVFADVQVSDPDTSGNSIGSANTSRNIAVAPNGSIYVLYYNFDGIYIARSNDRGENFEPSIQLSDSISGTTEPELAVSRNGVIYVAWTYRGSLWLTYSNNNGESYSVPEIKESIGDARIHMSTDGNNVYIVNQSGSVLFANNNKGLGMFQRFNISNRRYVYADVLFDLEGTAWIPTDDPNLYLFRTLDGSDEINEISLDPPGQVFFSSYSLSDGPCGTFIFTAGNSSDGYRIDTATGQTRRLNVGNNSGNSEGRTLFADNTGTLIDGYQSAGGDLMIAFSSDQGQNFSTPILVANGQSHNISRGFSNGDVLVAYSKDGSVYTSVYEDLLKFINLIDNDTPVAFCNGGQLTLDFELSDDFNLGGTINAFLSDENGSFKNPILIGSQTAGSTSDFVVNIPTGLVASDDYLILIESTTECVQSNTISLNLDASQSIGGNTDVCTNSSQLLTGFGAPAIIDPWVSSNTSIATIDESGILTALSTGISEITYTDRNGCKVKTTVSVLPEPSISGPSNVCEVSAVQYKGSGIPKESGSPWSIDDTTVATIDENGFLEPLKNGTVDISYTTQNNCVINSTVEIATFTKITGQSDLCLGQSTQLVSDTQPSTNPWDTKDTNILTVDTQGRVTTTGLGTTIVYFTNFAGCTVEFEITVSDGAIISGNDTVCVDGSTTLASSLNSTDTSPWMSSDPNIATVDNSGTVRGVSPGIVEIFFDFDADCAASFEVEIVDLPIISGPESICINTNPAFTSNHPAADTAPWTVENNLLATIDSDGILTPKAIGSTILLFEDENGCVSSKEIEIIPLPVITLDQDYFICLSADQNTVLQNVEIKTNLNVNDYSFKWFNDGTVILGENSNSIFPSSPGTYTVEITNKTTSCQNSFSTVVNASSPPQVSLEIRSSFFSEQQSVEVIATGLGQYEYSVDNQPFTHNNLFTSLSIGEHLFTARDLNSCGSTSEKIFIVSYPRFFTPNDDGFNDTWFVSNLKVENEPIVYIYDRFGKLLKQLKGVNDSWDGTFNGAPLPSSDYWFRIELLNTATNLKENFSAHFTLKR